MLVRLGIYKSVPAQSSMRGVARVAAGLRQCKNPELPELAYFRHCLYFEKLKFP